LPLVLALPWAKVLGKRVVAKVAAANQGVEAGDLRRRYGPLGRLLAWTLGHVDLYVATTAEIGEALQSEGYGPERIVRVPNFVDTNRFLPAAADERERQRRELGFGGHTVVLHSGRLTERKGCLVLLEAFALAAQKCTEPGPLLCFLGDGPQRAALEERARALGIAGSVRFDGFHEDPWRYLQAADVLALASFVEGLPNALLEGMACGLPVVATRLGGSVDVIQHDVTGLLVPSGDAPAMGEALARVMGDPGLRARLGKAANERIREGFTLDAIAPLYLDLYRRALRR
jgi:glycosyltransferase involved in cell wall biosynthesis